MQCSEKESVDWLTSRAELGLSQAFSADVKELQTRKWHDFLSLLHIGDIREEGLGKRQVGRQKIIGKLLPEQDSSRWEEESNGQGDGWVDWSSLSWSGLRGWCIGFIVHVFANSDYRCKRSYMGEEMPLKLDVTPLAIWQLWVCVCVCVCVCCSLLENYHGCYY